MEDRTVKYVYSKHNQSLSNKRFADWFPLLLLNNGEVTEEDGNFCENPCKIKILEV